MEKRDVLPSDNDRKLGEEIIQKVQNILEAHPDCFVLDRNHLDDGTPWNHAFGFLSLGRKTFVLHMSLYLHTDNQLTSTVSLKEEALQENKNNSWWIKFEIPLGSDNEALACKVIEKTGNIGVAKVMNILDHAKSRKLPEAFADNDTYETR